MAQAQKINASPFPSPPGLEAPDVSNAQFAKASAELRAAALEGVEEKLAELGASATPADAIQIVRDALMQEIEVKITEKTDELWTKGQQKLCNLQQKHSDKNKSLQEEVTRCQERQRALEADNAKLKQLMQGLVLQFSTLGGAITGVGGGVPFGKDEATAVPTAAATPGWATPAAASHDVAEFFTPGSIQHAVDDPSRSSAGDMDKCIVPPFPFRTPPASPAPPLSLAEALGSAPVQRATLSLEAAVTPRPSEVATPFGTPGPTPGGSEVVSGIGKGSMFTFTLRKADGADLGLNVSHNDNELVLRVEGVRPDGAVDAWNRQCAGSAVAEKIVMTGDRIVSVNGITKDPQAMLEQCRDKHLLKLCVLRGERPLAPVASAMTTLRAEASAFVPMSADASVFVPMSAAAEPPAPVPEKDDDQAQALQDAP